ncbi:hypothetical protein GCM10023168_17840 [Fodinibacter luteus]|uniref:Uncharacterized protein n=1 Tax=Fodinibacter luteus TaxID=552064 RepID=A0ABP8KDK5_9MICO
MQTLDQVGRLVPSSLEVSRAAAARHARTVALEQPSPEARAPWRDGSTRRRGWLRGVVVRLP